MDWLKNLRPQLFKVYDYDEVFVIDTDEEESIDTDLDSNSSEKRHSSEEKPDKVEKTDIQTQTEEGLVDN
jgi:hypothetical protein